MRPLLFKTYRKHLSQNFSISQPRLIDQKIDYLLALIDSYAPENEKQFMSFYKATTELTPEQKQTIFDSATIHGHFPICKFLIEQDGELLQFDSYHYACSTPCFDSGSKCSKMYYLHITKLSHDYFYYRDKVNAQNAQRAELLALFEQANASPHTSALH